MFSLNNRIALVTGGSRGLGRSVVLELAKDCRFVGFTYAGNAEAAQETINLCAEFPATVQAFQASVDDATAMAPIFEVISEAHGAVDLLVNNAGINQAGTLFSMDLDKWSKGLSVNLTGSFVCSQLAARGMMRKGMGSIIMMSSITGLRGLPGQINYATSKAGMIGMAKALAWELAPFGITVNSIAPGWLETGMAEAMPEKRKQKALAMIQAKRFGKPEEVAAAVRYLASEEGRYMTAQTLVLDGGII